MLNDMDSWTNYFNPTDSVYKLIEDFLIGKQKKLIEGLTLNGFCDTKFIIFNNLGYEEIKSYLNNEILGLTVCVKLSRNQVLNKNAFFKIKQSIGSYVFDFTDPRWDKLLCLIHRFSLENENLDIKSVLFAFNLYPNSNIKPCFRTKLCKILSSIDKIYLAYCIELTFRSKKINEMKLRNNEYLIIDEDRSKITLVEQFNNIYDRILAIEISNYVIQEISQIPDSYYKLNLYLTPMNQNNFTSDNDENKIWITWKLEKHKIVEFDEVIKLKLVAAIIEFRCFVSQSIYKINHYLDVICEKESEKIRCML